MTSALDTLLEAAKFIEQQEELSRQRSISSVSGQATYATSFPPLSTSGQGASTSSHILPNNTNQPTNVVRYVHNQQTSSPLGSPVLNSNNTGNNGNILLPPNQQFPTLIRLDGNGSGKKFLYLKLLI